jgi:hypothetical protein
VENSNITEKLSAQKAAGNKLESKKFNMEVDKIAPVNYLAL